MLFALGGCAAGAIGPSGEAIELVRDRWGIAHVFARSEQGAWFGAGVACAQDRPTQMDLNRRTVQGRLAEILGAEWIDSDRKFRTLGLTRHARRLAGSMAPGPRALFEAYARGVNRALPAELERWTVADSLAVWMRVEERFARGWRSEAGRAPPKAGPRLVDESGVIVPEAEFKRTAPEVYQELRRRTSRALPAPELEDAFAKASHAWAVAGRRSTTGKPILESDPQMPVTFPPLWYEVHVAGGGLNARGIGLPGAPGFLIGWNERIAWGATALGSDPADLHETEGPFEERRETIHVKDGEDVEIVVRTTELGPVVNDLLSRPAGKTYALRWVTLESPSSLEGLLLLPRARNWEEFERGLEKYHTPGINVVYADVDGHLGYRTVATIPVRDCVHRGRAAHDGCPPRAAIPFREMPRMVDPEAGFIAHANNAPVGKWYPHAIFRNGDTARSWRLREILSSRPVFSPGDFLSHVHRDSVNPLVREFIRFALGVVREDGVPLDEEKLRRLESWDGRCLVDAPAWPLVETIARRIPRSLRGSPLAARYGGGTAGVSWLLKELARDENLLKDPSVREWLRTSLRKVFEGGRGRGDAAPPSKLLYQDNLEGFGSLRPEADLAVPPLQCVLVPTIWSQLGNSYTQVVDLADVDRSLSMLPPGISEDPSSPHSRDQVGLWQRGEAHPAPITRAAVERVARSRAVFRD